jgi:hypothetical protein
LPKGRATRFDRTPYFLPIVFYSYSERLLHDVIALLLTVESDRHNFVFLLAARTSARQGERYPGAVTINKYFSGQDGFIPHGALLSLKI